MAFDRIIVAADTNQFLLKQNYKDSVEQNESRIETYLVVVENQQVIH